MKIPTSIRKCKKMTKKWNLSKFYETNDKHEYALYWKRFICGQCSQGFITFLWHSHSQALITCVGGEYLCIGCIEGSYFYNIACEEHYDLI